MPHVARGNATNVNALRSENFARPVSVIDRPSTNTGLAQLESESEGCRHIPPRPPSPRGQFHLTRVEVPSLVIGQFLLTTEAVSSQANNDLCPHTTGEDNSLVDLFPHTIPVERYLVSAPSRLTMVVDPCQAPSRRFLLTTPEVYCLVTNLSLPTTPGARCRIPTNLSPLTTLVEISQDPPPPPLLRTIPIRIMGLPTVKLRRGWARCRSAAKPPSTTHARGAPDTSPRLVAITPLILLVVTTPPRPTSRAIVLTTRQVRSSLSRPQEIHTIADHHPHRMVAINLLSNRRRVCCHLPKVSADPLAPHNPTPSSKPSRSRTWMT